CALDGAAMAFQDIDLFAALGVPDASGVVIRPCEDLLSISAEGRAPDRAGVASQAHKLDAALGIPDTSCVRVPWRRDHPQAVRAEGHAQQLLSVAFQGGDLCSGLGVQNANVCVGWAHHHPCSIRAKACRAAKSPPALDDEELLPAL